MSDIKLGQEFNYNGPVHTVNMHPSLMAHSMTLHDWFAGQALAACYDHAVRKGANEGWPKNWRDGVAQEAHEMADAMIAAREVVKP